MIDCDAVMFADLRNRLIPVGGCQDDEERTLMDDRGKLDIVTLNELCREFSTFNGLLLGKDGQGGLIRSLQKDITDMRIETVKAYEEMRGEFRTMHATHDSDVNNLHGEITGLRKDYDAAHDKIRLIEGWREKQTRSWSMFLNSALKVVLTVAGGVGVVLAVRFLGL
jgi:hypothetical protein